MAPRDADSTISQQVASTTVATSFQYYPLDGGEINENNWKKSRLSGMDLDFVVETNGVARKKLAALQHRNNDNSIKSQALKISNTR